MRLQLRDRVFDPDPVRPLVMGIVNATTDSFSDGGRPRGLRARIERAHELASAGADLIDVGGESGVTDRPPVPAAEEIRRVAPLIDRLVRDGLSVSVDTWKAEVARAALAAGAAMVNDASGLRDPGIVGACAEADAGLVVTHTRAAPKEKVFPGYDDVVTDVLAFLRARVAVAVEGGVEADRIVVDPGPDLAKTPAETVELLRGLERIRELGRPVMLAVSRKDFVGAITGRSPRRRLAGTLAAIGAGLDAGASVLRVHDVAEVVDFVRVRAALRGEADVPGELRLAEALRHEGTAA